MPSEVIVPLFNELAELMSNGVDAAGTSRLERHIKTLADAGAETPTLAPLTEAAERTLAADADEKPLPLLDLLARTMRERVGLAEFAPAAGDLKEIPAGGLWASPMPAHILYTLVPETRPFARRAKPPQQIENIETSGRRGQVADLRLVQIFLKMLTDKASNTVADVAARVAIPAFGPIILADLWPTLAPENRTFIAAYKIDVESTLARLLEKTGDKKKADKGGNVMKAVEKLMTTVNEDGSSIGPESLPIIKLALKHAPDQAIRRKLADILASMRAQAAEALPDLIDAFEHTGLSRDYYLIRPIAVLGKESPDARDAIIRAMGDRDATVRMMACFNLGQLGSVAEAGLPLLEDLSESDPDPKVREHAVKTLNKLRIRFGLVTPEPTESV